MNLALIPARGGSKRIPRKNIRPFLGKPVLAYALDAARQSGCFERIVVSTDDREIADTALARGAEVPFLRPAGLADDYATTLEVILHALDRIESEGHVVEVLCCLYPVTPLITADDLAAALSRMLETGADYCFPVAEFVAPIDRALTLAPDGRVSMRHPEYVRTRTQDLPPAFHDAGQFYWGRAEAFRAGLPLLSDAAVALPLPRWRAIDIDTEDDWQMAEMIARTLWRVEI